MLTTTIGTGFKAICLRMNSTPPVPGHVIHVDFQHRRRAEEAVLKTPAGDRAPDRDSVTRTFSRAEVAELFHVPPRTRNPLR